MSEETKKPAPSRSKPKATTKRSKPEVVEQTKENVRIVNGCEIRNK